MATPSLSTKPDRGAAAAHDHGIPRSPQWKAARKKYAKAHPFCEVCGPGVQRAHLEIHHVNPYHVCQLIGRGDLEFDFRNLVSLCEDDGFDHHLLVGHFDSFKSSNPNVRTDVTTYKGMTLDGIRLDARWVASSKIREKDWADMTDADKAALRKELDEMYPLVAK